MLRSTQTVDMETTRKSDFGRVFVAILNLIPSHLNVVIGDHYFELDFEVERLEMDENGDEAVIEWSGDADAEGGREGQEEEPLHEDPSFC